MMDAALVTIDWVTILFSSMTSILKMARFAKMGRFLRIFGLIRMVRVSRISESLGYRSLSEGYRLLVNVISILCAILWLSHLIACAWFLIGRVADDDTGSSWTDTAISGHEDATYSSARHFYQYTTSLHWSMAQLTLGAIEIGASNSVERIFNVSCLLIGLLVSSTLASSLSAAMINFQIRMKDQKTTLRLVESFLSQHKVERGVAARVKHQILTRMDEKDMLSEQDVPALSLLSSSLTIELKTSMFKPHLMRHPLFRLWSCLSSSLTQLLCDSIDTLILQPNDDLFVAGQETGSRVPCGARNSALHPASRVLGCG